MGEAALPGQLVAAADVVAKLQGDGVGAVILFQDQDQAVVQRVRGGVGLEGVGCEGRCQGQQHGAKG